MLISPRLAVLMLTDLTCEAVLPVGFDELHPTSGQFLRHDYVFVGDIAVRACKAKGRWAYDEREVRRAGRVLAALDVDSQRAERELTSALLLRLR